MEDPKQDSNQNDNNNKKRPSSMRDSFVLYNNTCASIRFGFLNRTPYVSIAKVLDNQKGKRPVAGQQMYDNDHAIVFSFNAHELLYLEENIDDLVSGKKEPIVFLHNSRGDNNKKVFMIGVGIDSDHEDEFGIAAMICPSERNGQVILDDPIESAVFIAGEEKIDIDGKVIVKDVSLIKRWFKIAIDGKMNTACDKQYFNGSYNRDNGDRGNGGFKPRFNYGRSNGARADDRPVVAKFGKSNNSDNKSRESAEDMFDASPDNDEDIIG